MDRHFSSSVGLPITTRDCDITTLINPPSTCSQQDAILNLQVKLSQLLSSILTCKLAYTNLSDVYAYLGSYLQNRRDTTGNVSGADKIHFTYNGWPRPRDREDNPSQATELGGHYAQRDTLHNLVLSSCSLEATLATLLLH